MLTAREPQVGCRWCRGSGWSPAHHDECRCVGYYDCDDPPPPVLSERAQERLDLRLQGLLARARVPAAQSSARTLASGVAGGLVPTLAHLAGFGCDAPTAALVLDAIARAA